MSDVRMEYVQPYPRDLECAICLNPWHNPIELNCRHVFCGACAVKLEKCAVCRVAVKTRQKTHFLMCNLVNNLPVRCRECGYQSARERFAHHTCDMVRAMIPPQPDSEAWRHYDMTEEEYNTLCALFYTFHDGGDSDTLSHAEVRSLARCLNFPHEPQHVERMMREMGASSTTDPISLHQFCWYMRDKTSDARCLYDLDYSTYRMTLFQFYCFDMDDDGVLELDDFVSLCTHIGSPFPEREEDAIQLFMDVDRTEQRSYIDLHQFLTYRQGLRV